jgi:GTP-binding protein
LISKDPGKSIPYSINNLQERGTFFIGSNEDIYEGQVVGENSRPGDMIINLTVTKKLTNVRASGSDDKIRLIPPRRFTLEEALEYIQEDEYVEVTPANIRLRKIYLKEHERKRSSNKQTVELVEE